MRLFNLGKKKQKPITYKFRAKDHTDYEIMFSMYSSNKLFEKMLKLAKLSYRKRLTQDKKKKLKDIDLTKVKQFEIDPRFYSFLHTILNRSIRDVEKQVNVEKIELISSKVVKGIFQREQKEEWLIKIYVGGQYVDKRKG